MDGTLRATSETGSRKRAPIWLAIRTNALLIPGALSRIGGEVAVELREEGFWWILLLTAGLLVLGYEIQKLYWTITRGWRKHVMAMPLDTVRQRLSVVALRFGYYVLWLLSFVLGSLGALLMFQWPPLLKTILSALFIIISAYLLWGVMARFLLSPQSRRLRVFPVDDAAARHWTRWSAILLGWFFGGWVAMQVLRDFDVDQPVRAPIAYALGLVLFALAMVALWRRPALSDPEKPRRDRARNITLGVSMLFAALWLLWVFGAMKVFWLVAVAASLPAAVSVVDRSVNHILTPPGVPAAKGPPSVLAAALERGARAAPDRRRHLGAGMGLGDRPRYPDGDRHGRDTAVAGAVQRHLDPAGGRLRLARRPHHHRPTHPCQQRRRERHRPERRQPTLAHAHLAADPAQHPVHRLPGHGGADGACRQWACRSRH